MFQAWVKDQLINCILLKSNNSVRTKIFEIVKYKTKELIIILFKDNRNVVQKFHLTNIKVHMSKMCTKHLIRSWKC